MLVKVRCGPFPNYSGLGGRARHPALLDDRGGTCTPRVAGRRGSTVDLTSQVMQLSSGQVSGDTRPSERAADGLI